MIVYDDSLKPYEEEFSYKGKKYTLREADGGAAVDYRNAAIRSAKMVDGKVVGVDKFADSEVVLLQGCVFEGEGKVSATFLRSLPNKLFKQLVETAKRVSDLFEKARTVEEIDKQIADLQAEKEALVAPKGEQNSTTDGSS